MYNSCKYHSYKYQFRLTQFLLDRTYLTHQGWGGNGHNHLNTLQMCLQLPPRVVHASCLDKYRVIIYKKEILSFTPLCTAALKWAIRSFIIQKIFFDWRENRKCFKLYFFQWLKSWHPGILLPNNRPKNCTLLKGDIFDNRPVVLLLLMLLVYSILVFLEITFLCCLITAQVTRIFLSHVHWVLVCR